MTIRRISTAIMFLFWLPVIFGCAGSPSATFYVLTPRAPKAVDPATIRPSVEVAPVTLPDLVDRPQLVIRVTSNQVKILEMHRWAAPLRNQIPFVIAKNLMQLLRPARVSVNDEYANQGARYRVEVDIQRFESVPEDGVTVEALWTIRQTAVDGAARTGHSLVFERPDGTGYDALVAAYDRALAAVSGEIASAILKEEIAAQKKGETQ